MTNSFLVSKGRFLFNLDTSKQKTCTSIIWIAWWFCWKRSWIDVSVKKDFIWKVRTITLRANVRTKKKEKEHRCLTSAWEWGSTQRGILSSLFCGNSINIWSIDAYSTKVISKEFLLVSLNASCSLRISGLANRLWLILSVFSAFWGDHKNLIWGEKIILQLGPQPKKIHISILFWIILYSQTNPYWIHKGSDSEIFRRQW